jgi:hypothetical protein
MAKITIDDNKAKRVAYCVASTFLLDCRSMRSLTHSKDKEMWMGLYVDVWKEFSSKLDDAFNRKSNIEILLLASEHMDDYAQPKEVAEKPGECITEYLLGGEFLNGCIAHRKLDDEASQEIVNDVASRMHALLKEGVYQLIKVC